MAVPATSMDRETTNMLVRALASYLCDPPIPSDANYEFQRGYMSAIVNMARNHRNTPTNLVSLAKLVDPNCQIIDIFPGQGPR